MNNFWIVTVMGIYLVFMIGIGIWGSKKTSSVTSYLLADRKLGPWVVGLSEQASSNSGWVSLGIPGEAFSTGIAALWNLTANFLGDLYNWGLFSKRIRYFTETLNTLTLPGFFEARFRDKSGKLRGLTTLIIVGFLMPYVAGQYVAAGKVIDALTTFSFNQGVVVGAIIIIVYTTMGGFFAVSWTDFFQGLIVGIGMISLALIGLTKFGLVGTFTKLQAIDQVLVDPLWGLHGAAAFVTVLSYLAIGLGWGGSPHVVVRYMGLEKPKDMKKAAVTALSFLILVYASVVLIGAFGRIVATDMGSSLIDKEYVMPSIASLWLPGPLAGVLIAAVMALIMSTADSQLLVCSTSLVEDFYKQFINKEASDETLLRLSRVLTVLIGVISIFFAKEGGFVYIIILYAWAGLAGAFMPTLTLSLWWKKTSKQGVIAGMLVGTITTIVWKKMVLPTLDLWIYEALISVPLSFIVTYVVSLMTKPPKEVEETFDELVNEMVESVKQDNESKENCSLKIQKYSQLDIVTKFYEKNLVTN